MKQLALIFSVFAIIFFAACSQKNNPAKVIPKTTYETGILPLMQAKCTPCHFPSKHGNKANFENYANAAKYSTAMINRIQLNPTDKGFMPFKNAKLTEEEISVFKKWISDGLPEK
jgi:hypothetical protein